MSILRTCREHLLRSGIAFAALLPAIAGAQQPEPVVPVVEGPTVQLHYGEHTSGASISPATDVDLFAFDGLQGETVRIAVHSTSYYWDPRVRIVVPGSPPPPLEGPGCAGGCCSLCSNTLDLTLTTTGQYVLIVTDNGLDETGTYELEIDRLPTLAPTVVQCNSTAADSIQTATDTDYFEFEGDAGAWVQVNVHSTSYFWDPRFELFAPDGSSLHVNSCGGGCCSLCSFTIEDMSLPATGVYRLLVTDAGFDETGSYEFTLQFIGGCPTEPDALPYCFGDGTGTPCPCGTSQSGELGRGCRNSSGSGGLLSMVGSATVASDSLQLEVSGLQPATIALFFQGTGERNAGLGVAFGDGLSCVTGNIVRLGVRRILGSGAFGAGVSGDPLVSVAGNVPATGATRYYQCWYRDASELHCTSSTFNLTNGLRIGWH